jgi:hypothetical protein
MTLPDLFWADERKLLLSILLPRLEHMAYIAQQHAAQKMGISFNPVLANKDAEAWAREYTDVVLNELQTTTEGGVGDILAAWIDTPGLTIGDLIESLKPMFGQVRAARIAQTEITRAYAQGEAMAYEREMGLVAAVLPVEDSHPGCYCWLSVKRAGNQQFIVWQTNKDDRVCDQDLDMPWGTVGGCQAMDNIVVSEGDYLGEDFDSIDLGKMAKAAAPALDHSAPPYIRLYGQSGDVSAWIVDGGYIRDSTFIDFTAGGNPERYDFIPANEIWIDSRNEDEAGFILLHELRESALMAGGMVYDKAHDIANTYEQEARSNPDTLNEFLSEAGWNSVMA